jgi:ubiquinone/menaquinone biosynthesis C-methylase UbiE
MKNILPNKAFYDELASDYDDMISFENAVEKKKKLFKNFLTSEMKSAADIGCGSGVDSIALSLSGLKVTAFDPSSEMLKIAKANTARMNSKVEFHNYAADNIPTEFNSQFDLVVSLGNTFANISKDKFNDSIETCQDLLKPKGQILLQVLNYEKIISENQRIVNITEGKDNYFIRFYDFLDESILFNILTFSKTDPAQNKIISTKIYPHTLENFMSGLEIAGFNAFHFYSNLELSSYNKEQSKDLVVRAIKN